MNALDHYDRLYGDMGLNPQDAARFVFVSGWNSAMEEAMKRVNTMPFGNDTRASFAIYFQQMMVVDPSDIEQPAQQCRTDGRCQYAIDSGAEGMGHCPKGKCVMPAQQESVAVYGYCPECGAKGVIRERRPNGNDKCTNGHTYSSSVAHMFGDKR